MSNEGEKVSLTLAFTGVVVFLIGYPTCYYLMYVAKAPKTKSHVKRRLIACFFWPLFFIPFVVLAIVGEFRHLYRDSKEWFLDTRFYETHFKNLS